MKALTLTQPWASAIALGLKTIETRSWRTHYRGPILIHAAKGLGPAGGKRGLLEMVTGTHRDLFPVSAVELEWDEPVGEVFPLGAVVAVAQLTGVWRTVGPGCRADDTPHLNRVFGVTNVRLGDYSAGRYAWVLRDVRRLKDPVPASGALGLWTPGPELLAAIGEG